ncbi:IS110 family transposase [Mycobacterium canetti]|uniref:IS110 family transposase n=1 Tax=Mycobacterium canetti TaxID=78331 RepID=UPI001E4BA208|nr:transposase [Mycobacterium canetti]
MQCRAREERPGRKTDLLDAEWLVHLLECGLLRGWFIPPADIKAARDVIRYRRKLVEHRSSKLQRLGNVLQDAGIKADSVASSVTTKSVRAMVGALIDGERRRRCWLIWCAAVCARRSPICSGRWKGASMILPWSP